METPFYCIVIFFRLIIFLCANKANNTEKRNKKVFSKRFKTDY